VLDPRASSSGVHEVRAPKRFVEDALRVEAGAWLRKNTASIVAAVTTTAMKPATTQVARLCITSQTGESHIIVGIGMALGLPPEQPSDDGA
jgi:hypothetical protein